MAVGENVFLLYPEHFISYQ